MQIHTHQHLYTENGVAEDIEERRRQDREKAPTTTKLIPIKLSDEEENGKKNKIKPNLISYEYYVDCTGYPVHDT